jgi:TolB-like protein/Tfp pilus assembly protein PilF
MATESKLAVLLHADVVGSTALVQLNEQTAHERIQSAFRAFSGVIEKYSGITRELRGDALVAEFDKASNAVSAALDFQSANTAEEGDGSESGQADLRVGVALGEVVVGDGTVTGPGIVIAQRLEQLASPGGVVIQGAIYEAIPRRLPFEYESMGEQRLKGFEDPIRAFSVTLRPGGELPLPEPAVSTVATHVVHRDLRPSIVVLPFDNMSGDADQEYFADGITEDLITALSKNRWLLVISRNSAFAYKGQARDIRSIGEELKARFALEGSIRKSGKRVRITAQLIDTASGIHIWAERYDRELEDIFDLQDEITATIAAQIEPEVGAAERHRAQHKAPNSLDAWDKYHLAFSKVYQYTKQTNCEARELFREVIELDPYFGSAHMGLAYTLYLDALYFGAEINEALLDGALNEAERAVALDDRDAMHHFILGRVHLIRKEYDQSIGNLETAVSLNPCMATAHCGLGDSLAFSGRFEEAVSHFEDAVRLGPRDTRRWAMLVYGSLTLMLLERYDESIAWAREAVRLPNSIFWTDAQLVAVLTRAQRPDEARVAVEKLLRLEPTFSSGEFAERFLFYMKDRDLVEQYAETLVGAGLPD